MPKATPVIPFEVDGFVGCRDQRSSKWAPGEMQMIYNMLPESTDRASRLLMRPGYKRYCAAGAASAVQMGAGSFGCMQTISGIIGGTYKTLLISTAGIYLLNHSTFAISLVLSAAVITGAGADISNFSRAVVFNDKLVVASGGKPWTWTGTTGAGVALINNAPSGGMKDVTVVGGKVVFLDFLSTLYWSEENDETIGYNTAPYSNFWTLKQTGDNRVAHIYGNNDGVFFVRVASGCGFIRGEIDANWKTTATKDELSEHVGTTDAYIKASGRPNSGKRGGEVLFFDQRARPMLYRPGEGLVYLWKQLPRLFGEATGASWDAAPWAFTTTPAELSLGAAALPQAVWYDKAWDCHAFAIETFGSGAAATAIFMFAADSDRFLGCWLKTGASNINTFFGYAHFHTSGGNEFPAPIFVDVSGNVFWQDNYNTVNATRSWSDEASNGVGSPVVGMIFGPPHGDNPAHVSYWFDQINLMTEARSSNTIDLGYVTSAQHKGSLTPADQLFLDSGLSNTPYQRRVEFGLGGDVLARWLIPQIRIQSVAGQDLQASVYGYNIEARPDTAGRGVL